MHRKWSRFGQKGGIGRAKGKVDKLAEPGSDELMFMEDEEVVVLTLLRELVLSADCKVTMFTVYIKAR